MTPRARILARALREILPMTQALGCEAGHGVRAWAYCGGALWRALLDTGDVQPKDYTEWRSLSGIPSQAEVKEIEESLMKELGVTNTPPKNNSN